MGDNFPLLLLIIAFALGPQLEFVDGIVIPSNLINRGSGGQTRSQTTIKYSGSALNADDLQSLLNNPNVHTSFSVRQGGTTIPRTIKYSSSSSSSDVSELLRNALRGRDDASGLRIYGQFPSDSDIIRQSSTRRIVLPGGDLSSLQQLLGTDGYNKLVSSSFRIIPGQTITTDPIEQGQIRTAVKIIQGTPGLDINNLRDYLGNEINRLHSNVQITSGQTTSSDPSQSLAIKLALKGKIPDSVYDSYFGSGNTFTLNSDNLSELLKLASTSQTGSSGTKITTAISSFSPDNIEQLKGILGDDAYRQILASANFQTDPTVTRKISFAVHGNVPGGDLTKLNQEAIQSLLDKVQSHANITVSTKTI